MEIIKLNGELKRVTPEDGPVWRTKDGFEICPSKTTWVGSEVLDHGFVYLVDSMGSDESVIQAARVSYGRGDTEGGYGLIRYLMRHRHTSPFEMVELKFHCRMPIFVARQWVRHRTASINEYSGRYSKMIPDAYNPGHPLFEDNWSMCWEDYEMLLDSGYSKEQARTVLPVGGYTEWYWKIDLHNCFHFLKLRLDPKAQAEIRAYARVIHRIVKQVAPVSTEAWEDWVLNAEVIPHQLPFTCSENEKEEYYGRVSRCGLTAPEEGGD